LTSYIGRLFYLGDEYHGSQWQPGLRTVQGELIDALAAWSGETHSSSTVQLAGRTDKGVHSVGQIVLVKTDKRFDVDGVNKHLPDDIRLWAHAKAPEDFKPRYSILMRHYRYYLDTTELNLDLSLMKQATQLLTGSHNFSLLSKPDGNRGTSATILNMSLRASDGTLTIDVYGISFLWKLVRKIVSLLIRIGTGELQMNTIRKLLEQTNVLPGGIAPAPPESLVLLEREQTRQKKNAERTRKTTWLSSPFYNDSFRSYRALRLRLKATLLISSQLAKASFSFGSLSSILSIVS
jgi:tRNA pseudouridine38-40 synthase